MIIYVLNDPLFCIPTKGKRHSTGEPYRYPDNTRWLWGNIYTNEADRDQNSYAFLISPDGTTKHRFNKQTFGLFTTQYETEVITKPCQVIWSPPTPMEYYGRVAGGIDGCKRNQLGGCCCPFIQGGSDAAGYFSPKD